MYFTLLICPLLAGTLAINRNNGRITGPITSILFILLTLFISLIVLYEVAFLESPVLLKLGYWFEALFIEWTFQFDVLTVSMFIPVLFISSLVQIYSLGYMSEDPHISRFYSYLSLFTFFMLILITADNLLLLFVGWEGVGLISYLLVNYWTTRIAANLAALKAFLINRIGDMFLSLGILLILSIINDLSLTTIFSLAKYINGNLLLWISITLILGAAAKSGQVGLHTWLPSAMEGPTPVSALLHSATMVTAGVYLLMRFSPLLEYCSTALMIITLLGSISALLGAACGLLENDLKRIIAFSTTSQLGYMIMSCGISQYNIALFHLINHAMFKALLFLAAGSVIHAINDVQDVRKMGGLIKLLPITFSVVLLANLSLMAFPFFTGFYSKDFLLELALIPKNTTSTIAYIFIIIAAIFTATYSARSLIMTFISRPNFPRTSINIIMDPSNLMIIPLIILGIFSVIFGYITHELFLGMGSTYYQHVLFTHPNHFSLFDGSLSQFSILKYLPPISLLILITIIPWSKPSKRSYLTLNWTTTLNKFNIFQSAFINQIFRNSVTISFLFDKGLIELLGPIGLIRIIHYISYIFEITLASGYISHYGYIIISVISIGLFILDDKGP